ncbi:MAG: response regulator [Candidatus Omnitrophota bacterium]|jgi:DNA-binding response OmpR family regulator
MDKVKILLVDDDVELCGELAEILELEGYHVNRTSNSYEGKALINQNIHDIVMLDYKMPGLSGVDLIKEIINNKLQCKVLVISGNSSIDAILKEEGLSGSIDGVIIKPYNVDNLLQKLKEL